MLLACAVSSSMLTGCELDDDPSDHDVPPGKGSLIVDNNTGDSIAVYINGQRQDDADEYDDESYDLEPGVYRVLLDQRSGSRSYAEEYDVIEGRRTILDVTTRGFDNEYDVDASYD